jgi:hypothetical protein
MYMMMFRMAFISLAQVFENYHCVCKICHILLCKAGFDMYIEQEKMDYNRRILSVFNENIKLLKHVFVQC